MMAAVNQLGFRVPISSCFHATVLPMAGAALVLCGCAFGALLAHADDAVTPPLPLSTLDAPASETPRAAKLRRLTTGSMAKFRFRDEPVALADTALPTRAAGPRRLSSWRGKTLLVHFWATWCQPCREEIPRLDRMHRRLVGNSFETIAISLDADIADAERFLRALGVSGLPLGSDPKAETAAAMSALGLPTSILVDSWGRELGRIEGSVDWTSDDAVLLIKAMIAEAEGAGPSPQR